MREFKKIGIFLFLMFLFGLARGGVCFADDPHSTFGDFDGDGKMDMSINYTEGERGYIVFIMGDGTSSVFEYFSDPGNPNPDDPNSSGSEKSFDQIVAILKKMGGSGKGKMTTEQFYQTPLGQYLLRGSKGPLPRWNPSDNFTEGFEGNGGGSGGGFSPNGGSIGEQIKRQVGHGSGDSAEGDDPNKNEGRKRGLGIYDTDGVLVHPKAQPGL